MQSLQKQDREISSKQGGPISVMGHLLGSLLHLAQLEDYQEGQK